MTQFLPLPQKQAFVSRLQGGTMSANPTVARSEKFMRGVEIMEQIVSGMQEKILSGQFKVRDADMHRLARADFPNRKQIVHEILHPEDRPAPQSSYSHYSGINYSALEAAVRRIQQDFDFLARLCHGGTVKGACV